MIPVNVRIIAAANKDMQAAVKDGSFRQDLLYRIDVLRLELPPLRKREQDPSGTDRMLYQPGTPENRMYSQRS